MLVLDNINLKDDNKTNYIALGSFDGLHLGHLSLIDKSIELAKEFNGKSTVFTFKNHPRSIISPNIDIQLIMSNKEKLNRLSEIGVDIVALKTFDEEIMKMDPENFINWLVNYYCVKGIVVGFNFRFGYKNLGDIETLKKFQKKYNYEIHVIEPFNYGEDVISSTRIRRELLNGNVKEAHKMLSRPYSISGTVIHGKKLGRTIGFPTANLKFNNKIIPKIGVYYTNVLIHNKLFKGITSVGNNPTVNGQELTIETYILDFKSSIYDEEIIVYFLEKIRDEKKFDSIESLAIQLKKDKIYAENSSLFRQN